MRPQDPNFPPEIPPIPSPRNLGQAELGDGPTPPPPAVSAEAAEENTEAPDRTVVRGNRDAASASRDLEPIVDAPGEAVSSGPTVEGTDRPYTPDAEPWTDSDLQDVEDPLPLPTPEPQPTYLDRGQRPDRAANSNARPVAPAEDVWADTGIPYQPKELGVVDQLLLLLADGVRLWKKGLRWVRSQLPPDLQRQLSDGVLTAMALGLLMLLLALWNPLGGGQGDPITAEPPPGTVAEEPVSLTADSSEEPAVDSASNPAPEPAPVVESTPEQSLIADIQNRVSRISRSYGAGLIQSVEVNLPKNTLDVNVAEAWYGLLATQQNEVAQDIFAQAQGLNFGTLQLRDPEGVVVARNPVVGPNMVVLRRLRSADADWRTQ